MTSHRKLIIFSDSRAACAIGALCVLCSLSACLETITERRISQVETGLLPLAAEKSRLGVKSEVITRMNCYGVPGVSVAVFDNGEISWAKGYGVARADSDEPVTTNTLFQAASISKPVTAVGALRLVREGKLHADENIKNKLTTWRLPENDFTLKDDVTLRSLLSHRAGVTVQGFPGYSVDSALPTLANVLDGLPPANTAPIRVDTAIGRDSRYSGGGYTIVQQLLIDVTGQSFPEFMDEAVLKPMGMRRSTFEQPLPESRDDDAAFGHHPGTGPVSGGYHVYPEMAAAGLWTTPTDLARFAIGVHEAATGKHDAIMSRSIAKDMLTAQGANYGMGLALAGDGLSARFSHDGINQGFDSMLVAYVSSGTGAIVMTNSNLSFGLINEILDSIARVYEWPEYPLSAQREIPPSQLPLSPNCTDEVTVR